MLLYWSKIIKKLRGKSIFNSVIHTSSRVQSGSQIFNSKIGKYSFCGYDCEIIHCNIGSFCSIANNVKIGGAMHPMDWVSMSPAFYEGKNTGIKAKFFEHTRELYQTTTIGNDVWIGQNALIKQGITIGNGAVIGMGSIVTKNVAPYSVVAGVPAKEIKKRFNEDVIKELLKSEWWNFSNEELKKFAPYFNNPYAFLKEIGK
jgi:acetyltransferase-like isoleucine patch superfamily enzyme